MFSTSFRLHGDHEVLVINMCILVVNGLHRMFNYMRDSDLDSDLDSVRVVS